MSAISPDSLGKFVAVLPDATPLIPVHGRKTATLEVRARSAGRYQVGGSAFCNSWGGELTVLPGKRIVWGDVYVTAIACANVMAAEATYLQALLGASRWRTEEGALILDNGTHILRFVLAPS